MLELSELWQQNFLQSQLLGGQTRAQCLQWAKNARLQALPYSAEEVADIAIVVAK